MRRLAIAAGLTGLVGSGYWAMQVPADVQAPRVVTPASDTAGARAIGKFEAAMTAPAATFPPPVVADAYRPAAERPADKGADAAAVANMTSLDQPVPAKPAPVVGRPMAAPRNSDVPGQPPAAAAGPAPVPLATSASQWVPPVVGRGTAKPTKAMVPVEPMPPSAQATGKPAAVAAVPPVSRKQVATGAAAPQPVASKPAEASRVAARPTRPVITQAVVARGKPVNAPVAPLAARSNTKATPPPAVRPSAVAAAKRPARSEPRLASIAAYMAPSPRFAPAPRVSPSPRGL